MVNSQLVSALSGLIISLSADYMPYLRAWFAKLTPHQKVAFVLISNLALAVGISLYQSGLSWQAVEAALIAWASSAVTHSYTRRL